MTTDTDLEKRAALVLDDAALLVELGWAQGAFARNEKGGTMWRPGDPGACSWCARGAITASALRRFGAAFNTGIEAAAAEMLRRVIKRETVAPWNDHPDRTQVEVAAALREAAAGARALAEAGA